MSENILQKNLQSIIENIPFQADELLKIDWGEMGNGVVVDLLNKDQPAYFNYEGQHYLLHSRYNPDAEANRIIGNIEMTHNYLTIVFGMGLGYHLFALKKRLSTESRVVIIEHNLDVLKYALNTIDFSELFSSGKFILLFGDEQQLSRGIFYLGQIGLYKLVHDIKLITLPNYYVYSKQNKFAIEQIHKVFFNTVISFGNDLEDQFFGFENMCYNTETILEGNSIDDITGKYTNLPAIIVASGPSLDKNIMQLKNAEGKALIIACDASMRACDKYGIRPDAVSTIERGKYTYQCFYEGKTFSKDMVLLGAGSIWPDIYREFPGKVIPISRNQEGFEELWLDALEQFKFMGMGHSCATLAFAVAKRAGCNPIILVGQDLAYTSGKRHSDLTHYGDGLNDDHEAGEVLMEDYEGNLLKSTPVFRMFKEWYELQIANDSNTRVINATEGGARIEGAVPMTLEQAIKIYCQKPVEKHLSEFLPVKTVPCEEKISKYNALMKLINRDIRLLKQIKKQADEHFQRLLKLDRRKQTSDISKLEKFVLKLKNGDKVIRKINSSASISMYYIPIILHTVTNVKKIGNDLTWDNVQRNLLLQQNLMDIITRSTDLIIKEYTNAKEILEVRLKELKGETV